MKLAGRHWLTAAMLFVACIGTPSVAHADGGAWLWFEYRLPVVGLPPELPRLSVRFWTDTRFTGQAGGLAQQFLRVGPVLDVTGWLTIAVHGTIYADRRPDGSFEQEARLEADPTFHARLGDFTFSDRSRLEYRWRQSNTRTRYRNQLRINYAPVGVRIIPFAWNEVLVDFSEGMNDNRAVLGVGFMLTENVRLETVYMLRSRRLPVDWQHDHLGILYLSVGLPARQEKKK